MEKVILTPPFPNNYYWHQLFLIKYYYLNKILIYMSVKW